MLKKRMKFMIILLIILGMFFGIGFTKSKINNYNNMSLPSLNVRAGDNLYCINPQEELLYKISANGKDKQRLTDSRVSTIGLIVFDERIYFMSDEKKLYSIDLNGQKPKEIGKCNIIMPYQPFFKLGEHVYYYDSNNNLIRVSRDGSLEKVNELGNKTAQGEVDSTLLGRITANSCLVNNYLFTWDDRGIARTSIEDGETTLMCGDYVKDRIQIVDNSIYYVNNYDYNLYALDVNSKKIIKLTTDKVITEGADFDSGSFYALSKDVYYTHDNSIIRLNLVTKAKEVIISNAEYFIIQNNNIYYIDKYDNGTLFKFDIVKGNTQKLAEEDFIPYIEVWDDFIFYGVKSGDKFESGEGNILYKKVYF